MNYISAIIIIYRHTLFKERLECGKFVHFTENLGARFKVTCSSYIFSLILPAFVIHKH
jgi:hypothetical protein